MNKFQAELDKLGRLPYAIIGGGVSGLYTGWRLRQERPDQAVAVFERSNRTGGRLLTWLPYGKEAGLRAELGGMRFFEQQQMVWNLIDHLELEKVDFYVDGQHLLWYLRGQRMAAGDTAAASLHYALNQQERGMAPDALIEHAINTVLATPRNQAAIREHLPGKSHPESREDWDKVKPYLTYKEELLTNLGYWNVLSDVLSYEGYQYTADAFGYYSLTSNWNAAEAMASVSMEFTQTPKYKTLAQGYSALPDTLAAKYTELGGHLFENASLRWFEATQDGAVLLHLQDSQGHEGTLIADNVILAMPRRSLDLLQPTATFDPHAPGVRSLLDAVSPIPAFKLFLLYETRWWEQQMGIDHGRSVSDLPIRQTYYFRPDAAEKGLLGAPAYGLLMASYDDARAVDYWRGMEETPAEKVHSRNQLRKLLQAMPTAFSGLLGKNANANPEPPPQMHLAPPAMLARAKEQLALLHGLNSRQVPDPVVGAYADWSREPYGGGWNFWQPQVDVKSVMERIRQPVDGLPVYLMGEAYSGLQGWVEGALTTAELVLREKLGVPAPKWLPTDYYLGW